MSTFMEKSIIDVFNARRMDEAGPKRKTTGELKKASKMRKKREMKTKSSKRSIAMKGMWKKKRKQMLLGWKHRKKLYGTSGRKAKEAMESIFDILTGIRESQTIEKQEYSEIKEKLMDYLYSVVADDSVEADEVYEALLFDIAPVMAIVESVVDRENGPDLTERDLENLDSYLTYVEDEVLGDATGEAEDDDAEGDDSDDSDDNE